MSTEPTVLALVMDKARQMTNIYLTLLQKTDLHKVFYVDDKPLNNAFWIMAHLPVTQNFLLLRSTGGEIVKIPWARQFGLGSGPSAKEDCPPLDEVKSVMDEIHSKSIKHVAALDPSFLDQTNTTGFEFLGENSVRALIVHAIRHEGTHAGHLGWLCKLNGIKTI